MAGFRSSKRLSHLALNKERGGTIMYIANTKTWYLERIIRLLAGVFVAGSVVLGFTVSPAWFYFSGFVGVMLTIFALTGFCPMSIILYAFGARERCKC
jgi:hypothetical protein